MMDRQEISKFARNRANLAHFWAKSENPWKMVFYGLITSFPYKIWFRDEKSARNRAIFGGFGGGGNISWNL